MTLSRALEKGAAPAPGYVSRRRAGAFLPRGAGRARHPRRGRRHARPLLDPAPERGPARRRAVSSAFPTMPYVSRSAAWAAASAARRARRANGRPSRRWRRAQDRPPCKVRLDRDDDMIDDRQAARFPHRLRGRLRASGLITAIRHRLRGALRLLRGPVARASATAPCSTPTMPISTRRRPHSSRGA